MDPGRVTVRGTGSVTARPDRLVLAFTVTSVSRSVEEALADVATRTGPLETVLDALAVPAEDRTTTGLTVRRETEWQDGRQVDRGYRASHVLHVHLRTADPVGELVRRSIQDAGALVNGPWWAIGPDNPARLEACRLAAADAARRAEVIAATLGARLGPVVAAAEPATKPGSQELGYVTMSARAGGGQADVDVQPGEMEVSASLDVSFAIDV